MTALMLALFTNALAHACDVTPFYVLFKPGMGTHTAYYCKATPEEKKKVINLVKQYACIPERLKALKKPLVAEEAIDAQPYSFTRQDAEKSGPILDVRLITKEEKSGDEARRIGYRVFVTGQKKITLTTPGGTVPPVPIVVGIDYELSEASLFERDCTTEGCNDYYDELCPP